jgi:hypothetical protein
MRICVSDVVNVKLGEHPRKVDRAVETVVQWHVSEACHIIIHICHIIIHICHSR